MSDLSMDTPSFFSLLEEKRSKKHLDWENAYNTIKQELDSLILCFDRINDIHEPEFQDLTLKFYTIHLCNFFVFHVRKAIVNRTIENESRRIITNVFANSSNIPSVPIMNDLIAFLVNDEQQAQDLSEAYKKLQEIRNKYAHGASNETSFSITMDEFKEAYESIKSVIAV